MMQTIKASQARAHSVSNRVYFAAIILFILLGIGLYAANVFQSSSLSEGTTTISQEALEATYGLHLNLIAVTAAGGMVDVRLKIVDAEKTKTLLQDQKNFPRLLVNGSELNVSEETKSQELKLEDNGDLFLLFPNAGNAVRPGTSVTLLFGETALEPVKVR